MMIVSNVGIIMVIVPNQRRYNCIQTGVKIDTWQVDTIEITESLVPATSAKSTLILIELLFKETLISLMATNFV